MINSGVATHKDEARLLLLLVSRWGALKGVDRRADDDEEEAQQSQYNRRGSIEA
jgi:hypothetical protein